MATAANVNPGNDWQDATNKCIVTEETLLRIINTELSSLTRGSKVEALMPQESDERNWRVALFELGPCEAADDELLRLEALGFALEGLSQVFVVAWPSSELQ